MTYIWVTYRLHMTKKHAHLVVHQDTKDILLKDCVEEYLYHHPEMDGVFISHDYILKKVVDYYLNR